MNYEVLQNNFGEIGLDIVLNTIIDDLESIEKVDNLMFCKTKVLKALNLIRMIKENGCD